MKALNDFVIVKRVTPKKEKDITWATDVTICEVIDISPVIRHQLDIKIGSIVSIYEDLRYDGHLIYVKNKEKYYSVKYDKISSCLDDLNIKLTDEEEDD